MSRIRRRAGMADASAAHAVLHPPLKRFGARFARHSATPITLRDDLWRGLSCDIRRYARLSAASTLRRRPCITGCSASHGYWRRSLVPS